MSTGEHSEPEGPPPPGGPAALTGFLFQLLGSANWLSSITFPEPVNSRQPTLLVLEPEKGGDAVHDDQTIQFKTRSGSRWTLSSIAKDVLPDLYRAMDTPTSEYVLQSDSGFRDQAALAALQTALGAKPLEEALGDPALGKHRFLFGRRKVTARAFFEAAGEPVTGLSAAAFKADTGARERFADLIRRLRIAPPLSLLEMRTGILNRLQTLVVYPTTPAQAYASLLTELFERARLGAQQLQVDEVLTRCGIDPTLARRLARLADGLSKRLDGMLASLNYAEGLDCRDPVPVLTERTVFVGPSGVGKTWMLARTACEARRRGKLVIWLNDVADAQSAGAMTAKIVANAAGFAETATGSDTLGAFLRSLGAGAVAPQVLVCLDRLPSLNAAIAVVQADWWQQEGVRVAAAMPASDPSLIAIEKVDVRVVPDFTPYEVRKLLGAHGQVWRSMAGDVRALIQRPVLADMYLTLIGDDALFRPQSEYELVSAAWNREPSTGHLGEWRIARARLGREMETIANDLLGGRTTEYPWPVTQTEWTAEQRHLLESRGLLRWTDNHHLELDHDRFLAWGLAEATAAAYKRGDVTLDAITALVVLVANNSSLLPGRALGYVAMDLIWFLTSEDVEPADELLAIVRAIIATPGPSYAWRLIATLGGRGFRLLLKAAETFSEDELLRGGHFREALADSASLPLSEAFTERLRDLLNSKVDFRRKIGFAFLGRRPISGFLPALIQKAGELFPPFDGKQHFNDWHGERSLALDALEEAITAAPESLADHLDSVSTSDEAAAVMWAALNIPLNMLVDLWRQVRPRTAGDARLRLDRFLLGVSDDEKVLAAASVAAASDSYDFQRLAETLPLQALVVLRSLSSEGLRSVLDAMDALVRVYPEAIGQVAEAVRDGHIAAEEAAFRTMRWAARDDGSLATAIVEGFLDTEKSARTLRFVAEIPGLAVLDVAANVTGSAFEQAVLDAATKRLAQTDARRHHQTIHLFGMVLLRIGGEGFSRLAAAQLSAADPDLHREGWKNALVADDSLVLEPLVASVELAMAGGERGIPRQPLNVLAAIAPERLGDVARRTLANGTPHALAAVAEAAFSADDLGLADLALANLGELTSYDLGTRYRILAAFHPEAPETLATARKLLAVGDSQGRMLAAHAAMAFSDAALAEEVKDVLLVQLQTSGDRQDERALEHLMKTPVRETLLAEMRRPNQRGILAWLMKDHDDPEVWQTPTVRDEALHSALDLDNTFLNTPHDGLRALWHIDRDVAFDAFDEGLRRGGRAASGAAQAVAANPARALAIIVDRLPCVTEDKTSQEVVRALRGHPDSAAVMAAAFELLRERRSDKASAGVLIAGWLGGPAAEQEILQRLSTPSSGDLQRACHAALERCDRIRFLQGVHVRLAAGLSPREHRRLLAISLAADEDRILVGRADPLSLEPLLTTKRDWLILDNGRRK